MKSFVVAAFLAALITVSSALADPLKPAGEQAAPLTIVKDGQLRYVITAGGSAPEKKAAEDLKHWLKEMTGADQAPTSGPAIRIAVDDKLAPEAYRIAVKGDDLI